MNRYFVIQDWMVTDLKLKGAERDIYAIIYGFSQDGKTWFEGSLNYIAEMVGISPSGALKAINRLLEKGLIKKRYREEELDGITTQKYSVKSTDGGTVKSTDGGTVKSTDGGTVKSTEPPIYNINNNIYDDDNDVRVRACVHTRACVREEIEKSPSGEDELLDELRHSDIWLEQMQMRHRISKAELLQYLGDFKLDQECRGTKHTDIRDIKRHFNDWLRIRINAKQDGSNKKHGRTAEDRNNEVEAYILDGLV